MGRVVGWRGEKTHRTASDSTISSAEPEPEAAEPMMRMMK
jgi:hypothetical protein